MPIPPSTPRRRTAPTRALYAFAIVAGASLSFSSPAIAQAAPAPPAQGASDGAPAHMLDRSLDSRSGRVLSMDDRVVVFLDERGRRREVPAGDLMAILPIITPRFDLEVSATGAIIIRTIEGSDAKAHADLAPGAATGLLQLTDNQRYTGDLAPPESGAVEDRLAWRHDAFGQLTFPFDRVQRFQRPAATDEPKLPPRGATPSQDTLLLANGDLLRGFLSGLADPALFETNSGMIEVEFRLVSGADLANPQAPPSGLRVWLADGSVVHAHALQLDSQKRLTITLSDGQKGEFNWERVRAVLFDAAGIMPLAAAPIRSQIPLGDRRFVPPIERVLPSGAAAGSPALDAWDLVAPGPMAVEFELPPGAARLATKLELDDPRGSWGDCEVVLSLDGRESLRRRLTSAEPGFDVVLDLAGASILKLAVEPGRYGPIRDRVALRRPLILVAPAR